MPPAADEDDTADPEIYQAQGSSNGIPPSRQRFKPQLSCSFCRHRKLKCDRQQPCQNCVKRNLSSSCTFIHAAINRERAAHVQKASKQPSPKDMHGKIRHLEELVVSLMQQTQAGQVPSSGSSTGTASLNESLDHSASDEGLSHTSEALGRIGIEDDHLKYVWGTHWSSILDCIAGLKESVDETPWTQQETDMYTPPKRGPDLLVGATRSASRTEILASIPDKETTDALVAEAVATSDIFPCIIHGPTFKKEYENFWKDPENASTTWIGLLYAVMCLTIQMQLLSGKIPASNSTNLTMRNPQNAIKMLKERTIQCLVLGNYTDPTCYTVQTLLIYYFIEAFLSRDGQVGAWMVVGLFVRAAMRLGYHRDASHYPSISVFQGEMQRRIWSTVAHLDLQTSCRVGLPRMIRDGMADTLPPRNLFDDDFDETTTVLPLSRPETEITPVGHIHVKHELSSVYGTIVDRVNSIQPLDYDDVMRYDQLLHDAHERIPEICKVRSVDDLRIGTGMMRCRKFMTELVYQKGRCVLHRKYLTPARTASQDSHPYSIKSCVDAAMEILQYQALMYEETQPGKSLYEHRWKATSLMTQDFLMAAMIVCLYLSRNNGELATGGGLIRYRGDEMLQALDTSFKIWDSNKCSSREALKAAKALKAMRTRFRGAGLASLMLNPESDQSGLTSVTYPADFLNQTTDPSPDISNIPTSSSFWPNDPSNPTQYPMTEVNHQIEDWSNINWESWDNQFFEHPQIAAVPDFLSFDPFPMPDASGFAGHQDS